ncbi:uncharacterized [Tachysurus ichikawai]
MHRLWREPNAAAPLPAPSSLGAVDIAPPTPIASLAASAAHHLHSPGKINTFRSGSLADRSTDALAKRSLFPYQQNQSIVAELRA